MGHLLLYCRPLFANFTFSIYRTTILTQGGFFIHVALAKLDGVVEFKKLCLNTHSAAGGRNQNHAKLISDHVQTFAWSCQLLRRNCIKAFSRDEDYRGTAVEFVEKVLGLKLHISKKIKDTFAVLPKRWIVERTFAWFGNYRRLSKDYEILTSTAGNMVRIAMLPIVVAKCV
uniref:Transposase DDE domain-containing protein n=1 Tax=Candidatus Kentrum sp. TUN TaxID=2126343 RepID=A0A451B0K0_9GAMM|nr:MAG: Transposase DDE domain-containing protein [Candidatus Kentron sp. TUN]VFK71801.1 MAG: Transposase DDE domain-containing protein [Candidatus Kentron sp. TUN]